VRLLHQVRVEAAPLTVFLQPEEIRGATLGKPMGLRRVFRTIVLAMCLWLSVPGMSEGVRAEGNDYPLQGLSSSSPRGWDLERWLGSALSIKPSYFDTDPRANIKLLDDGVKRDALDILVKSSMPGNLTGEAEVAAGSFNSQAEKLYHLQRNQLLRFRLAGDLGFFNYGTEYRSVGQGFRPQPGSNLRPDQEGSETWASQGFGPLRVKALYSNFRDNIEGDPRRPRTTKTMAGTVLGITLPGGDVLSLSYQRGSSETIGGPNYQPPQESWVEDLGASLYYYGGPKWDFTISSNYSPSVSKVDPSKKVASNYHALTALYRPTDSITMTPSLSLSEQRYSWSGYRVVTPTAMLSLSYFPPSGIMSLTTYGYYSRSKSSDGWYDVQTVSLISSLSLPLNKAKSKVLTFDLDSTQYLDRIYGSGSYQELLGRVMYTVKSF